jgi:hypothetical protein
MADIFQKLAEARMREWLSRPESERNRSTDEPVSMTPLEVQLFDDARALYERSVSCPSDDEAQAMREQAARIETRIMVLLEESGRPLAAQRFAQMLADVRASAVRPTRG